MRYIETFREGMHTSDVYLCKSKQIAVTKSGKEYGNLVLQDKTGIIDGKIWDLTSPGVGSFDVMDYVQIEADVTLFQGSFQLNIKRIRRAVEREYKEEDYLPVSKKDIQKMYQELMGLAKSIQNPYLSKLTAHFFGSQKFAKAFCFHSAAKTVPPWICGRPFGAYLGRGQAVRLLCLLLPYAEQGFADYGGSFFTISESLRSFPGSRKMITRMTGSFWAILLWGRR